MGLGLGWARRDKVSIDDMIDRCMIVFLLSRFFSIVQHPFSVHLSVMVGEEYVSCRCIEGKEEVTRGK